MNFFFHEKLQLKVDYMKIETSTHVRLWFEVQTIITVKKTTGAVARGDEKDSQERELNHWRSDCRELANSEFVFTELPSELLVGQKAHEMSSQWQFTWLLRDATQTQRWTAPRCLAGAVRSAIVRPMVTFSCRSEFFLTSFLATAPAPSSMWWSL